MKKTMLTLSMAAAAAFMTACGPCDSCCKTDKKECKTDCKDSACCVQQVDATQSVTWLPALDLKPTLFHQFDYKKVSVPDGLEIDANGDVIVVTPNYFNFETAGAGIYRFDKDRNIHEWFKDLPLSPITKRVHPMGIAFGPDGHLYICDLQFFYSRDNASRILRVIVENGKPVRCETVVSNFKFANGMRIKDNVLYFTNSKMDIPGKPHYSCVYAIPLAEMNKGEVKLQPGLSDPHVLAVFKAKGAPDAKEETTGADGITFDKQGRMYVGNFGDGQIFRVTIENGKTVKQELLIDNDKEITCCDGIIYHEPSDNIFITNSRRNAIHAFNVGKSTIRVISENEDTDGSDGLLDQPCEPLVVGDDLIIVNFDRPGGVMKNTKHDEPVTISVIKLPKDI